MTIVVGFIPSKEGLAAVDAAIQEAHRRESALIVVNSRRGGKEFDAAEALEDEGALDALETQLKERGTSYTIRHLVRGQDPADDLIAIATENDADLIIIGLRKRSPVGKLFLGSNAQRVLLEATCPVLAVKAP